MDYSVDYQPLSTSSTLINQTQDLAVRSISALRKRAG
jgi:hypothetical protein